MNPNIIPYIDENCDKMKTNDTKDFRPLTFVESIVVVILFNNLFN